MNAGESDLARSEGVFSRYITQNFVGEDIEGQAFDFVIDTSDPQELEVFASRLAVISFTKGEIMRGNAEEGSRRTETIAPEVSSSDEDYPTAEEVFSIPESELLVSSTCTVDDEERGLESNFGNQTGILSRSESPAPETAAVTSECDQVTSTTGNSFPKTPLGTDKESFTRDPVVPTRRRIRFNIPSPPGSTFSCVSDISVSFIRDSFEEVCAEMRNSPDFLSILASETDLPSFLPDVNESGIQGEQCQSMVENLGQLTPVSQSSPGRSEAEVSIPEKEAPSNTKPGSRSRKSVEKSLQNNNLPSSCIPNLQSRAPVGAALKRMDCFRAKKNKNSRKDAPMNLPPETETEKNRGPAYNLRPKLKKKKTKKTKKYTKPGFVFKDPRIMLKSQIVNHGIEPIVEIVPINLAAALKDLNGAKEHSEIESRSCEIEENFSEKESSMPCSNSESPSCASKSVSPPSKSPCHSTETTRRCKSNSPSNFKRIKIIEINLEEEDDSNDKIVKPPSIVDITSDDEMEEPSYSFKNIVKPKNPHYQFRFQFPKPPNSEQLGWKLFERGLLPRPPVFLHKHPQIVPCSLTSISISRGTDFTKVNSPIPSSEGLRCSPTI